MPISKDHISHEGLIHKKAYRRAMLCEIYQLWVDGDSTARDLLADYVTAQNKCTTLPGLLLTAHRITMVNMEVLLLELIRAEGWKISLRLINI